MWRSVGGRSGGGREPKSWQVAPRGRSEFTSPRGVVGGRLAVLLVPRPRDETPGRQTCPTPTPLDCIFVLDYFVAVKAYNPAQVAPAADSPAAPAQSSPPNGRNIAAHCVSSGLRSHSNSCKPGVAKEDAAHANGRDFQTIPFTKPRWRARINHLRAARWKTSETFRPGSPSSVSPGFSG